jgi:hypothetical protein
MSNGGLSKARLRRMHDAMGGLVTLVGRRGEVRVDTIGTKALGGTESRP